MTSSAKPVIAAFDFDGTITMRDTLLSFLFFAAGKWPTLRKLAGMTPEMLGYILNKLSRQEVKEKILTGFFAGMPVSQLSELGESFSRSSTLKHLIRPAAKRRIEWHRHQQHRCVLVSASIDLYLEPWGKLAGFDDVICSRLEVSPGGTVTGKLKGLNCWGAEKKHRLEERFGPKENYILYFYGDSRGDQELLASADYPFFRHIPSST